LHVASSSGAPLDLVAGILMAAGGGAFDICTFTDRSHRTLLASAACGNDDIAVHKQLIKIFPGTL